VAVPLRQNLRIGAYLARQKLARREKFPLIVELEPLLPATWRAWAAARSSTRRTSSSSG